MRENIQLRIILKDPNEAVWFGIQKGSGNNYEVDSLQVSTQSDLVFNCTILTKLDKDGALDFSGPLVQGPRQNRFIYIDIGSCAGQKGALWTRRLKIPLAGITFEMIEDAGSTAWLLEAVMPAKGKDGGPSCGTIKPFTGWKKVNL